MAKFKDVLDALEAGKKVRRKRWHEGNTICLDEYGDVRYTGGLRFDLTKERLEADDWEIVEPTVTITRAQFDEAVNKCLKYTPAIAGNFRQLDLDQYVRLNDLIKALGL